MPLAKHHKPYVAVLGVALGALAIDSLVLGEGPPGPTPAQASAGPAASVAAAAPVIVAAAAEAAPAGRPRLAARLQSLKASRPEIAPSLFCEDAPWLKPPVEAGAPVAVLEGADAPPPVSEPEPVYQLTSVLAAGERSCVILEGRTLRLGDWYADLRLHAVEHGAAVFERNGQLVRVEVQVK